MRSMSPTKFLQRFDHRAVVGPSDRDLLKCAIVDELGMRRVDLDQLKEFATTACRMKQTRRLASMPCG